MYCLCLDDSKSQVLTSLSLAESLERVTPAGIIPLTLLLDPVSLVLALLLPPLACHLRTEEAAKLCSEWLKISKLWKQFTLTVDEAIIVRICFLYPCIEIIL